MTKEVYWADLRDHGWHKLVNQQSSNFREPIETTCGIRIEHYDPNKTHGLLVLMYASWPPKRGACETCLAR